MMLFILKNFILHKEIFMTTQTQQTLPPSIFPARFQILSGSALKLLACILMLIDHTGVLILANWKPALRVLFTIGSTEITWYRIVRDIGRSAFPIFCFLLIEGFLHTRNRRKYGQNLLLFALISEIPWNFVFSNTWHHPTQNVFFTLFLGYLGLCALEALWEKPVLQLSCIVGLFGFSYIFHADYGWHGFLLIMIMYLFRTRRILQALVSTLWMNYEWKMCFSFISINMYNGKRGFIQGKAAKYFFYLFYPLHITILVIIRNIYFLS